MAQIVNRCGNARRTAALTWRREIPDFLAVHSVITLTHNARAINTPPTHPRALRLQRLSLIAQKTIMSGPKMIDSVQPTKTYSTGLGQGLAAGSGISSWSPPLSEIRRSSTNRGCHNLSQALGCHWATLP